MSTSRRIDYKPRADRTGLPLLEVGCPACSARFTTAAKTHTTCPDCGKDFRVHRSTRHPASAAVQRRKTSQPVRQNPDRVQQQPVFPPIRLGPLLTSIPAAAASYDDDPWTYTKDGLGRLVLGEQHDGYVLPASRLPVDWVAEQLAGRRWKLRQHGTGMCHVIRLMRGVGDVADWIEECHGRAEHDDPPLCRYCFGELQAPYDS